MVKNKIKQDFREMRGLIQVTDQADFMTLSTRNQYLGIMGWGAEDKLWIRFEFIIYDGPENNQIPLTCSCQTC